MNNKKIKLTGTITLRLSTDEVTAVEMLGEKGIKTIHMFRRGLDAYLTDVLKNTDLSENNS